MIAAEVSAQSLIERILGRVLAFDELRELRHHPHALVRANAIRAFADATEGPEVLEELVAAAEDPANQTRLMGTTRICHLAVETLYRLGTPRAIRTAEALLRNWPEPDRSDLLWYVRSEGLAVLNFSSGIDTQ